jgi:type II secretion system protein N
MKKGIFFVAFGLVALLFFIYQLFPSGPVRRYLADQVRHIDPGLQMDIGTIRPGLPPGLVMRETRLWYEDIPLSVIDRATARPKLISLLGATPRVVLHGKAHGGHLNGTLMLGENERLAVTASAEGLHLETLPLQSFIKQFKISGNLSTTLVLDRTVIPQTGQSQLTLTDGGVTLTKPLFDIDSIGIKKAEAVVELKADQVKVSRLTLEGPEITATFSGSIQLRRPLRTSEMALTGTIKPRPVFLSKLRRKVPVTLLGKNVAQLGLPIVVKGTIDNPTVMFR